MQYKDYSTLKAASKVAFKEIAAVAEVKASDGHITTQSQNAYTVLERKSYNPDTGAESTREEKLSLADLERRKAELTADKDRAQAELTEVGKMIADIKKL